VKFKPRDYQDRVINLALESRPLTGVSRSFEGAGLFLEPGSGKTVAELTATKILLQRKVVSKVLVVAPNMVAREVWTREAAKWEHTAHLKVTYLDVAIFSLYRKVVTAAVSGDGEAREIVENDMTPEDREFLFLAEVSVSRMELLPRDWRRSKATILNDPAPIHVISRDHLYLLAKTLGKDWPYEKVIGDESTSWKNIESKRSVCMLYLRREGLVKRLDLLSGTPSPKNVENLFAQVRLLDNGRRLGDKVGEFRQVYMSPDYRNDQGKTLSWKDKPGAHRVVAEKIKDICLSVRADSWRKTLPPRTVERIISLPGEVMAVYRELSQELQLVLEGGTVTAEHAAILSNKLIQIASGAVFDDEREYHVLHNAKLDALDELIEELDGEPLVICYWFKPTLARLRERYGRKLATVKTKGFIDLFAAGRLPLLALQPGSAGHGLDGLQHGGHHMAVVDMFHDWELYQQIVSRLDRSGQRHQVTVHQILAADTKDIGVGQVLADRGANQGLVMDALGWRR